MGKALSDVVSQTSVLLGDSTNTIWSQAELQEYVKLGYKRLLRETKAVWKQQYVNDQDGVSDAPLPSDLIEIDRATWNAKPLSIESEGTVMYRDDQYLNEDETGDQPTALFISGTSTLRKYPVPNTTITSTQPAAPTTAEVLNTRLEYFSSGVDLDTYAFEIPDYWSRTVRFFALWKAYSRKGKGHNKKMGEFYSKRWDMDIMTYRRLVNQIASIREGIFGGRASSPSSRRPADPRLPWQYGRVTRG